MQTLLKGPIFIITDDLATSDAIEALFQSIKLKAIAYSSATQAVSAYKTSVKNNKPPQVILIDIELKGDRDGFQISEELTEIDKDDDTIRIILTDHQIPYTKTLSATAGAVAILHKSQYTGLGLLEELDVLLRRKEERKTDRARTAGSPNRKMLALLFGTLLAGLSGIGAYDWHCQTVRDAREEVAAQAARDLIRSLFEQQERNDKTRQDDKYVQLEKDMRQFQSSLGQLNLLMSDTRDALSTHGLLNKVPQKGKK